MYHPSTQRHYLCEEISSMGWGSVRNTKGTDRTRDDCHLVSHPCPAKSEDLPPTSSVPVSRRPHYCNVTRYRQDGTKVTETTSGGRESSRDPLTSLCTLVEHYTQVSFSFSLQIKVTIHM